MQLRLVLLTCLALLALPVNALAAQCAPPGTSGVDQYIETVPGASCNPTPSGSGGGDGSGSGGGGGLGGGLGGGGRLGGGGHHGGLPPGISRQLAAQGPAGRAVKRLVATTGTASIHSLGNPATGRADGGGGPGPSHTVARGHAPAPAASGQGFLPGLLHPILSGSSSGGVGLLLPLFLGGMLAITLAVLLWRRRRVSPAGTSNQRNT